MRNTIRQEHDPKPQQGHDLHAPVTRTDHCRGAQRPSITVIEYGDFESSSCRSAEPAVRMLLAAHPRTVQLVFRHFPLEPDHPLALMAAEATEAAAAQGKFWEMHDALLLQDAPLDRAALDRAAQELGLDMAMFRAALDDEIYRQRIREQEDGAVRSHLRESPGFFVNGRVCDVSGGMHELANTVAALDGAHVAG
jgi:protein-disulfide isomerase